jgi:NACalpha-BTF3-like transcription factor
MKQYYYPYEIEVILKAAEETVLENPPMDAIVQSRAYIDKKYGQTTHRAVKKVDDDGVRLLMREFEISRDDAEDAMEYAENDVYMASVYLLS